MQDVAAVDVQTTGLQLVFASIFLPPRLDSVRDEEVFHALECWSMAALAQDACAFIVAGDLNMEVEDQE